uniref:MASP-related molecule Type 2 n=1 Tax=Littorina littorea TaxID=31216 RepID=A0A411DEQ1_LITLI|nr:MASP-related molecule Type 2 [Littorina littorea]
MEGVKVLFGLLSVVCIGFLRGANGQLHGDLRSCPANDVTCNNTHVCILPSVRCDGRNDCGDWEDESNCPTPPPKSGCGGPSVQRGMFDIIHSMNFPYDNYTDQATCKWDIFVPTGYHVKVEFVPIFDIEYDVTGQCRRDAVYIYDTDMNHLVGEYCGSTIPPPMELSSNHAIVTFKSDYSHTGKGFGLHWFAVVPTATTPSATLSTVPPTPASTCNGVIRLDGKSGLIASPGYSLTSSAHYPPSANCGWQIIGPPASKIVLHFDDFMLENSPNCSMDSLSVYDGFDETAPLLGTLCGKYRPGDVISSDRQLFISFFSDGGVEGRGFHITWTTTSTLTTSAVTHTTPVPAEGCDGHPRLLTSASGVVTSPGYDGTSSYLGLQSCQWLITVPQGEVIDIKFTDFEMEWARDCDYDFVAIYDDDFLKAKEMLCGQRLPLDFTSTSHTVLVKFTSDAEVGGVGFNLTYASHPPRRACTSAEYTCKNGLCIPYDLVCNGLWNCFDGDDELICPNNPQCGRPDIQPHLDSHRVVGGREGVEGSWPWQVSVRLTGKHLCGGTLIDPYWVLCAAHCFQSNWRTTEWSVMAGQQELMTSSPHQQLINVSKIITRHDYDDVTSANDVALIKLAQPAKLGRYVNVACLPSVTLPPGEVCYITGFGETLSTCCAGKLKQAAVPLISANKCNLPDWYDGQVLDSMVCAGYENGGADACGGDSGGPLACEIGGHWVVYGITSWGISCADVKNPGVYIQVVNYLKWIQETIAKYS